VIPGQVYTAQLEAAELRRRATEEAQAIRSQAYDEGFAAGRAEAARQLFDLAALQAELAKRTERDATQAALLVAGQLLGSELGSDPTKITALLRPHLERMRRSKRMLVRLHPLDAAWLEQQPALLTEMRRQHTLSDTLEVRADAGLQRGDCVVESNLGELDARVETRLKLLAAALNLPELAPPAPACEEPK
jgi:flagellar assembly protein FliH